ncbi:hypothetical protein HK096_008044 [Nowakowskiella sp. JEL0078]|nr:hypothetical protein HK096_008044 [Nowakowskiella sp. JEL0078]
MEVLFEPRVSGKPSISLIEGIQISISKTLEVDRKIYWEKITLTGGLSQVKVLVVTGLPGIKDRIEYESAPFIVSSLLPNELQPKEIKFSKLPEYFAAYHEQHDAPISLVSEEDNIVITAESSVVDNNSSEHNNGERPQDMAYLGACVISRNLFLDIKFSDRPLYVTKAEYSERGPSCIHSN